MVRHISYSYVLLGKSSEFFSKKLDEYRIRLTSADVSHYNNWWKTLTLRKTVQSMFVNYIDIFVAYIGDPMGSFEFGYAVEIYCNEKFNKSIIKSAFCSTPEEAIEYTEDLCKKLWQKEMGIKNEVASMLIS